MRRGNSTLLIVLGMFLLLIAAAGFYFYSINPMLSPDPTAQEFLPTPLPDVEVVQAAIDIEPGTLIDNPETFLKMGMIPNGTYAAQPEAYFTTLAEARNLKTLAAIRGNEPVMKAQLGPAGLAVRIPTAVPGQSPLKAFPIQVNSLTGVAGLIQPGDFVDVMASFNLDVTTFRPGIAATNPEGGVTQSTIEQISTEGSVKVLLQDVEVLDVVKPAPQPTPEGGAEPPPPTDTLEPTPQPEQIAQNTTGTTFEAGNWLLVIGVTNQEAEVLRFALDRGIGISTLLRAVNDHTTERTVGSTVRILIDNYGMPIPSGLPPAQHPGEVQVPNVPALPQEPVEAFAPTVTAGSDE